LVAPGRENFDQTVQREKALAAGKWARAISTPAVDQPNNQALEQLVEISPGIEL